MIIGRHRLHFEATESTNDVAASLAGDEMNAGTVVTADVQTRGRGQHGRIWQSSPGANVLMSVLLFPPPELRRPALLTAFAAVAVAETVEQFTQHHAAIKWPNDVLVEGRKIAGILIEAGKQHVVVGIGVNVNESPPDLPATSLSALVGRMLVVREVTDRLIATLDAEYEVLLNDQGNSLESRWVSRLNKLHRSATLELMDGSEVTGIVRRLTFDGVDIENEVGNRFSFRAEAIRHVREARI